MSSTPSTTSPPSNFEAIFNAALAKYTKQTGRDLRNHPLTSKMDRCDSAESILAIFKEQAEAFQEFINRDSKLLTYLQPIVNGLYALSTAPAVSTAISVAFPPASPIFSGISILLSMPKSVKESYDALVEVFECMDGFVRRLMIYTKFEEPTLAMTEVVIKIMAELISVLALTTKQMSEGKLKKYAKKLLGENEIESVLQRLDRLTGEESKMTVAQTLDIVHGLVDKMEVVMEGGKASTDDIRHTLIIVQDIAMQVNKMERDRLQEKFRHWLSPPDPWLNHNIAREAYHRGTAKWFTQGDTFAQWKSTGSLLWVNGLRSNVLAGSGKTIISSSIIEDLHDMCPTGLATLSIFYCDFRDTNKQDARNLLSSILIQLCHQSDAFSQVLSSIYSIHNNGSRQPSINALLGCLKSILKLPGQGPLYLVIDGLDECPDSSGCPTPREQVLVILQELIDLRLPHVHLCIASRPEIDIRGILENLAVYNVRLHEQVGQNQDIVDYINGFVRSDPRMRRWREADKRLVIETLTRRAGGMFRWVHCQLETLRFCFPPSIRRALDELPESLDATYERALLGINKRTRDYARHLFQCLVVSTRPLRVEEVAELFAIQPYGDTTLGLNLGWRPEDPEEFILSACSTLVSIVDIKGERIVQFSHFSAREYLTSHRIAISAPVSHFHILPKPAHTLLARACLSVLFELPHSMDIAQLWNFPLAPYAAEHWVEHAQFEDISSDIRDSVDCLFDRNKPHLDNWIWLYNGCHGNRYHLPHRPRRVDQVPLYYAALFGFRDLVERLVVAHPGHVNARGDYLGAPLNAAIYNGHLNIALFLLERGADAESRGWKGQTALYMASSPGYTEVVRPLIDRGADPNTECDDWNDNYQVVKWTPLHVASRNGRTEIARVLLEHGADVNYEDKFGKSALHLASRHRSNDFARLLLDHGANLNALDTWGETALHRASFYGRVEVVTLLLEYGANVDDQSNLGRTPLHCAADAGHLEIVEVLLDHDADVNAQSRTRRTALHEAAYNGYLQVVIALLKRGADPHAQTDKGETPFLVASQRKHTKVERFLSEHTGERM